MNRPSAARILAAFLILLAGWAASLALGGTWPGALAAVLAGAFAWGMAARRGRRVDEQHPRISAAPDLLDNPDFDSSLEAVVEPLLVVANDRVARANRAALRLLGAHIVGEDIRIAIRHPAAAERLMNPAAEGREDSITLVGLGQREQRWEMRAAAIGQGRLLVHLMDRTGSYAAERMRVDFVANASHELRTPLAAILGFIETLGDAKAGGEPETRERFLKIMFDEARRMQRLVDDLMSLSRIEAEKYQRPDSPVDLTGLVAETARIFHDRHGTRGLDVVTLVEPGLPPVNGDRAQLSQLLHNLISNSMKYGRPGTPVTVGLQRGGPAMARLWVADEGEGIHPDHIPRLTERFYRVDSGRSRAMGGTGLGLAIVKHIVERHRGRMEVDSALGKGTKVTIHLPLADAAIQAKRRDAAGA